MTMHVCPGMFPWCICAKKKLEMCSRTLTRSCSMCSHMTMCVHRKADLALGQTPGTNGQAPQFCIL